MCHFQIKNLEDKRLWSGLEGGVGGGGGIGGIFSQTTS